MLSASSNQPDPISGDQGARALSGEGIRLDRATQQLIASAIEPRWDQFLRAWEAMAAAKGRYPSRADLDPLQLGARLLPNIFLVDIENTPKGKLRFRFRLLGQAILDRETTRPGDYLDLLGSAVEISEIELHYRDTMAGQVSIRTASLVWNDVRKDMFRYSVMMLPLSDNGVAVTHLMGLALYDF
ncbi:MAG TPA: hypothetical protein VMT54_18925 [Candidatus Cybelea sp.]|nr:hypothetical protein [Candidatus Cybelea sp.]